MLQQFLRSLRPAIAPAKGRIIGGHEAEPHSSPWQVLVEINGNSYCGGALITQYYVVTAGHCGIVVRSATVYLGVHNLSDTSGNATAISVSHVIIHADYDNNIYLNDIALLALSAAAPITKNIQLANLPPKSDLNRSYLGENVVATGWGLYQDVPFPSIFDMSTVLQEVEVPVLNWTECAAYYNDEDGDYIYETNVCTSGYQNKGTCDGDSGGPLILDRVLIGITSFGTTLCELCSPSVYTRIVNYLDWIVVNTDLQI